MSSLNPGRDNGRLPARTLHLKIPPDARYARTVRDALAGFALLHHVSNLDTEALIFAVGEALANAIEHAASGKDIEVIAEVDAQRFVATVIDYGDGFRTIPRERAQLPEPTAERGRGIPIMQRCTDFFDVKSQPGAGTAIVLGRLRRTNPERQTAS
jgi:serine/threonine-protein kinase RsbW